MKTYNKSREMQVEKYLLENYTKVDSEVFRQFFSLYSGLSDIDEIIKFGVVNKNSIKDLLSLSIKDFDSSQFDKIDLVEGLMFVYVLTFVAIKLCGDKLDPVECALQLYYGAICNNSNPHDLHQYSFVDFIQEKMFSIDLVKLYYGQLKNET